MYFYIITPPPPPPLYLVPYPLHTHPNIITPPPPPLFCFFNLTQKALKRMPTSEPTLYPTMEQTTENDRRRNYLQPNH